MIMLRNMDAENAARMTADVDYAVVGPRDNRIHENQTTRFPYRTICYLARDFGGRRLPGATGVLIAPTLVLTAGHCLFSHFLKCPPRRIAVIPARADQDTMPLGSRMADQFYVPVEYLIDRLPGRLRCDYGVIRLERPFETIHRFMPVQAPTGRKALQLLKDRPVTIAGYPSDRPVGTLWRHTEHLKKISPWRLFYTVDTCPGHSGSPVYCHAQKGRPTIIGIHTSGIVDARGRPFGCRKDTVLAPPGMLNSGIRITRRVRADIFHPEARAAKGWMIRLSGQLEKHSAARGADDAGTRL